MDGESPHGRAREVVSPPLVLTVHRLWLSQGKRAEKEKGLPRPEGPSLVPAHWEELVARCPGWGRGKGKVGG